MEKKSSFFIYDGREMGILIALGLLVALFAFTLGVHLGKKVGPKGFMERSRETKLVQTDTDKFPNRQELNEQEKGVNQALGESLNQSLHDEVARTGVKLDTPRQIYLPSAARSRAAGATTLTEEEVVPAMQRPNPAGRFTIQVGSYPSLGEAKDQVEALEALALTPFIRAAHVEGKGRWYRVFLEGFNSRAEAEDVGDRYVKQHMMESYVVAPMP